jgi:hypothetical protein
LREQTAIFAADVAVERYAKKHRLDHSAVVVQLDPVERRTPYAASKREYEEQPHKGRVGVYARACGGRVALMKTVEGTFTEIERLKVQQQEALVQLKDAERKLEELNERRIELAPAAFTGDEVADRNLMALEGEASKLSRGAHLARNAVREFERLLEKAKKRRAEKRQRLARERFEELAAERYELGVEVEEAMSTLLKTLERYKPIHSEQVACARGFGDDSPATNPPRTLIQKWLVSRLREYLGLRSIDHYDRPLAEVDSLAATLESKG